MMILLRLALLCLWLLFLLMSMTMTSFGIAGQLPLLSPGEPGAATNLQAQVECSKTEFRKGIAHLRWTVTSRGSEQRVDVTIFPEGFETGQFETIGPLPPDWSSLMFDRLKGQAIHHWRVLTRHGDGWVPSQTETFAGPTCVANKVQ